MEITGEHNRNVRDKSPLMYAMQCSKFKVVNYLLGRGADSTARMAGGPRSSVLGLCVSFAFCDAKNHDRWIKLAIKLIDLGADPSSALWTALHGFGGIVDRDDLIRLLLDRGADPDQLVGNSGDAVRELVAVNSRLYTDKVLKLFTEKK